MGTNYYIDKVHIGKQSCGWQFLYRTHPSLGIFTTHDWKNHIWFSGEDIIDEYGEVMPRGTFYALIHGGTGTKKPHKEADYTDAYGAAFVIDEFC